MTDYWDFFHNNGEVTFYGDSDLDFYADGVYGIDFYDLTVNDSASLEIFNWNITVKDALKVKPNASLFVSGSDHLEHLYLGSTTQSGSIINNGTIQIKPFGAFKLTAENPAFKWNLTGNSFSVGSQGTIEFRDGIYNADLNLDSYQGQTFILYNILISL